MFLLVFSFFKGIDQRYFGTFSSSKSSFPLSKAPALLQYLGSNVPLGLNQLFGNEILGTAVTIKERHAEEKGMCVFLRLEGYVESNEHPLKIKLSI